MTERGKIILCRLVCGGDLLDEITGVARRAGIRWGTVTAIGAVRRARIGYYDQEAREYRELDLPEPGEICSCLGNISLREGDIFVHAHIVLADAAGRTAGGHLCPGTEIFAAECRIEELGGVPRERKYDRETGLALWALPEDNENQG